MSSSNCCFLTCIQISRGRSGGLVFPSLSEFSTVYWDPHKGFGIVNKAEIDAFLELSCFLHDPVDVGNLISGSSAFSKSSLNIWKFMVHILLKDGLDNFEHYYTSMWDECNCAVVWAFLGFPGGSEVKASASNAGDPGSIPGSGRSPGKGNGNPLQYSCLENPMDRGAWRATVHRVAKSQTRRSNFTIQVYM